MPTAHLRTRAKTRAPEVLQHCQQQQASERALKCHGMCVFVHVHRKILLDEHVCVCVQLVYLTILLDARPFFEAHNST